MAAAAEQREVPEALVPVLTAAENALETKQPAQALSVLRGYTGAPDPLHALLLGHALLDSGDGESAERAYRNALKLDPTLKQAAMGLARVLVDRAAWRDAVELLGRTLDADKATASQLGLYARVAYELRDLRLASLLVERGILRFPGDRGFRRLDIAILAARGAHKEAYEAAWTFVGQDPSDARAWRQLASISQDSDDEGLRLAALEAAVLANPNDQRLARSYARAQFQAGHTAEALATVEPLLSPDNKGKQDQALRQLAVRIAEQAGNTSLARRWLEQVPAARRSRALQLLEARIAIREGKPAEAEAALDRLIASGEATGSVFLWAAQFAENAKKPAKAEALYHQASDLTGPSARLAVLHLARLLHRIEQPDRAEQLLATYIAEHPDDTPARSLLAVITRKRPGRR